MKRLMLFAIPLMLIFGCTNWEQTTYKMLAASQAVINQAQADYEASATAPCAPTATACLPHSTAVYNTVNKAKKLQTTAVDSMVTYEEAKAAGGTTASLTALEADVNVAIQQLPTIITDIKALYTKGGN
jgi:hypothetical protein